jgi:hypothetical protein
VGAGVSNKGYLKFGRNSATKEWMYTPIDIGAKTEINAVGKVATKYELEVKVVEMAIGLRSGVKADGLISSITGFKIVGYESKTSCIEKQGNEILL